MQSPPNAQGAIRRSAGAHDVVVVLLTQFWTLATTLGLQSLLAWRLAPEGRGAYAVAVLTGTLLAVVCTLGVDRATQQQVIMLRLDAADGLWAGTFLTLAGSAIGCVGAVVVGAAFPYWQQQAGFSLPLCLLLVPGSSLLTLLQLQYAGFGRFRHLAVITMLQTTTGLLLTAILTSWVPWGVDGALFALVASQCCAIACLLAGLRERVLRAVRLPRWSDCRLILSYGARYYVARVGTVVDLQFGVGLLALYGPRDQVGLFAAISALLMKVLVFPDSMEAALLPRIAANPLERLPLVERVARFSSLVTGLGVALMCSVAYPVVTLLLSPRFSVGVPLLFLLAPGVVIHGASKVPAAYLRAIDRPGSNSWAVWIGLSINAGLFLALYPIAGVRAAAWAMAGGLAARGCVILWSYCRTTGSRAQDVLLPSKRDVVIACSMIVAGVCQGRQTRESTKGA